MIKNPEEAMKVFMSGLNSYITMFAVIAALVFWGCLGGAIFTSQAAVQVLCACGCSIAIGAFLGLMLVWMRNVTINKLESRED